MKLTTEKIHSLHRALQSAITGYTGPEGKPTEVFAKARAKLWAVRTVKRLGEAVAPVQEMIEQERAKLLAEEPGDPQDASRPLTGPRKAKLEAFLGELAKEIQEIPLEPLPTSEVAVEHFSGPAGMLALSELEGVLLTDPPAS